MLFVGSIDERDMLIEADPALFHITDHYKNYPTCSHASRSSTRKRCADARAPLEGNRAEETAESGDQQVSEVHPPFSSPACGGGPAKGREGVSGKPRRNRGSVRKACEEPH